MYEKRQENISEKNGFEMEKSTLQCRRTPSGMAPCVGGRSPPLFIVAGAYLV
jgi:hypothetical protein